MHQMKGWFPATQWRGLLVAAFRSGNGHIKLFRACRNLIASDTGSAGVSFQNPSSDSDAVATISLCQRSLWACEGHLAASGRDAVSIIVNLAA
jgi:hypothetical protein